MVCCKKKKKKLSHKFSPHCFTMGYVFNWCLSEPSFFWAKNKQAVICWVQVGTQPSCSLHASKCATGSLPYHHAELRSQCHTLAKYTPWHYSSYHSFEITEYFSVYFVRYSFLCSTCGVFFLAFCTAFILTITHSCAATCPCSLMPLTYLLLLTTKINCQCAEVTTTQ